MYPFTLINTATGTYLDPTSCVLVPDEAATKLWHGDQSDLSDSEIAAIGLSAGLSIPLTFDLVSCIADALWGEDAGKECNADTINAIVHAFRHYRPDLVPS